MNDLLDFNNAEPAQSELIPDKTEAKVNMMIRPGGYGPVGWFKMSSTGSLMLDVEFTVLNGRYAKRKFWGYFVLESNGTEKGQIAVNIARTTLRAIVESAKGINPTDTSPAAVQGRKIVSIDELNELEFAARIKVETGKDGYEDKNRLGFAITPDMKQYHAVMNGNGTSPANGSSNKSQSSVKTSHPQQSAWAGHQQAQPSSQPQWQSAETKASAHASPVPAWAGETSGPMVNGQPATQTDDGDIPF